MTGRRNHLIRLDRPERLNAFTADPEFRSTCLLEHEDGSMSALVITGTGTALSLRPRRVLNEASSARN